MPLANRLSQWISAARRNLALIALAGVSATVAVVVAQVVFPLLSINNDEPIYRLQAEALSHGELFLPTGGEPDAFRPWLAAVRDGHYVLKYPPFFPALVALSLALSGGPTLLFAALAAAAVVMTYVLAMEVLGDHRRAILAAALVATSPLAIILSALVLPYMTTFVLLEVVAWGLIRSSRSPQLRPLVLAGLAFGLVFAMRPFDALLFTAPLMAFLAWRSDSWAARGRCALRFGAPSLVGLGAFLATNAVMTGSALRPPFALLEPKDALGFGVRRLYPTDVDHRFGLAEGVEGVISHGLLLNRWLAGGTLLLVLALVALVRTDRRDPLRWLFLSGAMVPLGYLFFWGPWNASVLWGGTRWVGPFYFLPVLIPLALLGARGLTQLHRWRPWAAVVAATAMALFTVVSIAPVVQGNLAYTQQSRDLDRLLSRTPDRQDKLVLVAAVDPYLMHPSAVVANRWDLSGPVLNAVSRGDADIELAVRFSGRTPYRLNLVAGALDPGDLFSARLERLRLVRGSSVRMNLSLPQAAGTGPGILRLASGAMVREYRIGPEDHARSLLLTLDTNGAEIAGRLPDRTTSSDTARAGVKVEMVIDSATRGERPSQVPGVETVEIPARVVNGVVEALVPSGSIWTAGDPWPGVLTISMAPSAN